MSSEVIAALVGAVVGIIAESIAHYFVAKGERMIELGDILYCKLHALDYSYKTGRADWRNIKEEQDVCHLALVRVLRLRSHFFQRRKNIALLDKYNTIVNHHSRTTIEIDLLGDGIKTTGEDTRATLNERSAMLQSFIKEIENLNPHF